MSIFVCAGLLTSGCSLLPSEEQPLKPPLVKPAEAKIVTELPRIGTLERKLQGSGTFESVRTAYHDFSESGGRIAEVLARAGDAVKAGDPLVRLETADMEMTLLQRRLEVEKKRLGLDEAKETGSERRVRIAGLELEIAERQLASIEDTFENKVLTAKIDGIVIFEAEMQPGDVVEAHRSLYTIADPTALRLAYSSAASNALSEVEVGMTAAFEYGDATYEGKVVQTPATAPFQEDERLRDKYAKTVYIDIATLPEGAEIGDSASVTIVTNRRENALIVPKSGVRKLFGRTYVQVLEGESRREIDVEIGLETPTETEIVSGLEAEQQVILQ
ncbi:HlyD family efflux transporter periplasmic adaptor subunit [Paenibacillus sp. TRM 82003]|nr:HlyD family efflux transporter periplasmic adaptor subunit [Paenibacillus sp. TRM 82003]